MKAVLALKHKPSGVNLKRHLLLSLFAFLFSGYAFAADVTIAWDHSTSSSSADFGGYRVHYGETSKTYTSKIDVEKTKNIATITGLTAGKTYYFALKSYSAANNSLESTAFSNEVSRAIPVPPVALTADFTPAAPISVVQGNPVTFNPVTTGAVNSWAWSLTEPNGTITTTTAQTAAAYTKNFSSVGTYSLKLTVTGSSGSATSAARQITVTAPPPPPPVTPPPPAVSPAACSTTGLVAAYGFEETSGTTARDTSGKGNVGTIREAVRIKGRTLGRRR